MIASATELLQEGAKRLSKFDLPRLEAMVLLEKASGIKREKLLAMRDELIDKKSCKKYFKMVTQRANGVPSAYLLKEKEFYGYTLTVSPSVLIPRPDTEILVEEALQRIKEESIQSVWDLCTGSGAIIIAIGLEAKRQLHLYATDISKAALKVARQNCRRYLREVRLARGDLLKALPKKIKVDMIVTNPPYLTHLESDEKKQEGWIEPDLALRAGEDGLDLIKLIIKNSLDRLNPNGYLLIEASGWQMDKIEFLLTEAGYLNIKRIKDLGGRERVITGQLSLNDER